MHRRDFLSRGIAVGATAALGSVGQANDNPPQKIRIVGISCSPRKGMTTAASVQIALDAAQKVSSNIVTEMIDLGGLNISGWAGGARPGQMQEIMDDYPLKVEPALLAQDLFGIIIGSPVYFRTMSSLCKAFLERTASLRSPELRLGDKSLGVLSVGAYRNGGQELVIEQIQAAMLCHEVMVVGGKPRAHQGATLWNHYNDDITKDIFGIETARKLGMRVAESAQILAMSMKKYTASD